MRALLLWSVVVTMALAACSGQGESETRTGNKGIGPFGQVNLGPIDMDRVAKGEAKFNAVCATCHKAAEAHIGPQMAGLTKKRTPEWILNMIVNPTEMCEKDPDAKALFEQYKVPMPVPAITQDEALDIFEYIRSLDQ